MKINDKLILTMFFLILNLNANCFDKNNKSALLVGKGNGGRLGDSVLIYCKAKYLSYKYNIPLICTALPFFNKLSLSHYEKMFTSQHNQMFDEYMVLLDYSKISSLKDRSVLLDVNFYCRMRKKNDSLRAYIGCAEYPFDWFKKKMIKYPEFGNELKRNLQPRDIKNRKKPERQGAITVAVATRMGSGPDGSVQSQQFYSLPIVTKEGIDKIHPYKFVPQQFYVDQVKRLSTLLRHCKMHIYFFIDKDKNFAEGILAKWRQALVGYDNITIECNVEKNWQERILDDLYIMSNCDCLIRGCSHFAGIAQLAGNHKIIIGPDQSSFNWVGNCLIFKRTFIYFQDVQKNMFQQCVYEDTSSDLLYSLVANIFDN